MKNSGSFIFKHLSDAILISSFFITAKSIGGPTVKSLFKVESIDINAHLDASPIETFGVIALSKIGFPYLTSPITKYGLLSAGRI